MKYKPLWAVYRTLPKCKSAMFWIEANNKMHAEKLAKRFRDEEEGTFFVVKLLAEERR